MTRHYILSIAQKNFLLNAKGKFASLLKQRNIDLIPIEIKNNQYVVPEATLHFADLREFKKDLDDLNFLNNISVRELTENDLLEYDD